MSSSTVDTVTSADGTAIAVERDVTDAARPPLVIVLGAFHDRASSAALGAGLKRRFTVWRFDRRGRGDSGDTPGIGGASPAREVEDLAAVVAAIGHAPYVYGHSSGAALALEAAAAGVPMRRLVAYEPPYVEGAGAQSQRADQLDALVAEGRAEAAVELFLQGMGTPPGMLAHIRASPGWPKMVALAHTLAYDVRLVNDGVAPVERLQRITIPVLGMFGGLSPDWAPRVADLIAAAVPEGRALLLEGQTHAAANGALLPELVRFFSDDSR